MLLHHLNPARAPNSPSPQPQTQYTIRRCSLRQGVPQKPIASRAPFRFRYPMHAPDVRSTKRASRVDQSPLRLREGSNRRRRPPNRAVREVPQHLREGRVPNGGNVLRRSRYVRRGVAVHHAHRWEGFGDADAGVHSD